MRLVAALLVLWFALAVIGAVVHALLWLAWVAVVLFVVTAVVGWLTRARR